VLDGHFEDGRMPTVGADVKPNKSLLQ
jgi:hypothetical protein